MSCPYCHKTAILRPASFVYGEQAQKDEQLYVCPNYPACNTYVFFDGRTKFETYAQTVLRTTLADYCRDVLPEEQCISLDEPITADGEGRCRYELLPDPQSDSFVKEMENWDVLERCEKAYTGVCKMGVEAIRLHLSGYTGVEIARMYGREPNQVQAWMSKARKKMKSDPAVIAALQ